MLCLLNRQIKAKRLSLTSIWVYAICIALLTKKLNTYDTVKMKYFNNSGNAIRDEGSTAAHAAYTACTV